MAPGPVSVIVRLWWRSGKFRAEVRPLHGGEPVYLHSGAALARYLAGLAEGRQRQGEREGVEPDR